MSEGTHTLEATKEIERQQMLLVRDNENLDLWFTYYDTDPNMAQQADKGSYKFTTVDATYQRFRITALWGPYGGKWGLRNLEWSFSKEADGRIAEMILQADFFYPSKEGKEVSFPILNDWPWRRAGETAKKLQTNTITKALSYLGVSCDLWDGKFEDDPYREFQNGGPMANIEKADDIISKLQNAPADKLEAWWEAAKKRGLNKHNFMKAQAAYRACRLKHDAAFMFGGDESDVQETDGDDLRDTTGGTDDGDGDV